MNKKKYFKPFFEMVSMETSQTLSTSPGGNIQGNPNGQEQVDPNSGTGYGSPLRKFVH